MLVLVSIYKSSFAIETIKVALIVLTIFYYIKQILLCTVSSILTTER